ncbi:MAG: phosphodiester glycosidase family protein [Saprospiraceae bacterium]|nr:phosphodiester glycosidase family protein [Saprospiraceae bacterium]
MKKYIVLATLTCMGWVMLAQPPQFAMRPFSQGLSWAYPTTDSVYGQPQFVQYLRFGPKEYSFDLAWVTDTLVRTSDLAWSADATAAINGGFFDMKRGGSVTYLRADNKDIHQTTERLIQQGNEILEGAIVITKPGQLKIRSGKRIERKKRYSDVLVTGPLLLRKGKIQPLDNRDFNNDRHPRSCLCTDNRNRVYFITIDGRHTRAKGMSLVEVIQLVQDLGCWDAINLDGGGSTTLFLRNQGVINHPSDNRNFDAQGERPCANALLAIPRESIP